RKAPWRAPALLLWGLACPPVTAQQQPGLVIEGVAEPLLGNLQAHLVLPEEPCDAPRARLRRALPGLQQAASTALNALGYYHARVALSFSESEACWQLDVNAEPGEPTRLRAVNLAIEADDAA